MWMGLLRDRDCEAVVAVTPANAESDRYCEDDIFYHRRYHGDAQTAGSAKVRVDV